MRHRGYLDMKKTIRTYGNVRSGTTESKTQRRGSLRLADHQVLQRDAAETSVIQCIALQQKPVELVDVVRGCFLRHLFCNV